MNGTPRLRSAFPTTPRSGDGGIRFGSPISPNTGTKRSSKLPPVSSLNAQPTEPPSTPLIPLDTIDAATQRLIVFSFYVCLWAYRLYDFYGLVTQSSTESLWLFMKWVGIDGVVLFGLPALRIPWLEYSAPVVTILFMIHVLADGMLMFRIGLPLTLWVEVLAKSLYDREMSISEHKVKASDLFDSSALISGKQVINILPEGSALLNPNHDSFCLGGAFHQIELPIQINQTQPILIELLRVDLDTAEQEVVTITKKQLNSYRKHAIKHQHPRDSSLPLVLHHSVKKSGQYTLQKIVDESKLEVRPRKSDVVVVQCPTARIKQTGANKCKGELSDIAIEVIGTPPLKVKYRKMVNGNPVEASFQSIQPDDFASPLSRSQQAAGILIKPGEVDVSWARAQRVTVPINETLFHSGQWWYAIDEVQDAMGNTLNYAALLDDYEKPKKAQEQQQLFTVHERPKISLRSHKERGCDAEHPLKVAKGDTGKLPVKFETDGKTANSDIPHTVEYLFTAEDQLLATGEHNPDHQEIREHIFKNIHDSLSIGASGLYSLASVQTQFCEGEVMEPVSCFLQNPPEPEVQITSTPIADKCAGNSIGLSVTLNFVGTPPFIVSYTTQRGTSSKVQRRQQFDSHRGQFDLTPHEAGAYVYVFTDISDLYYGGRKLENTLKQTVKPSASAHFVSQSSSNSLCLYNHAEFQVKLGGEGPWDLEWEVLHNGRRVKNKQEGIVDDHFTINTGQLDSGGDYSLSLVSVKAGGCTEFAKEEVRFNVRQQRPKAGFGAIDGKRDIHTLEGKPLRIPVRLTGERPWTVRYKNKDDVSAPFKEITLHGENSFIDVHEKGKFQLNSVRDSACDGVVDQEAAEFKVEWIQRPTLSITEHPTVQKPKDKYVKTEVCEGDEDFVELAFTGNAPFDVKYEEHAVPEHGPKFVRRKELNAALGAASIQLETTKAGVYEYKFTELSDTNYDHASKKFTPISLTQRVNPRPSAQFAHPGKTYSFCTVQDSGEDVIPITLTGVPPFHLEVEIRHSGTAKPEVLSIPNIATKSHTLRIPNKYLHQGHSYLSIGKVRDSRGCQSKSEGPTPSQSPRVQISVHDPPKITALEAASDYCVGDYLNFRLQGSPPFTIYYTFKNKERKATASSTQFRRIADEPGVFTINSLSDSASECKAVAPITKEIHAKPRGTLSKGKTSFVDIHEGGETELQFDFVGTPPFEFTYIRSENGKNGKPGRVLETKTEKTDQHSVKRTVGTEGAYELVSVKDAWCLSSKIKGASGAGGKGQKLLMN